MKYLLASDFDGTLCVQGQDEQRNIDAINRFRAQGHLFGIVTGRDYVCGYEAIKAKSPYPFDFMITSNGAQAADAEGNLLFSHGVQIQGEKGISAVDLMRRCLEITEDFCGFSLQKSRFNFHPDFPAGGERNGVIYSPLSAIADVDTFISAAAVSHDPEGPTEAIEMLRKEFGTHVNLIQNGMTIDIMPIGVDKSAGVACMAEILHIPHDHVWTVGDNYNDMGMIQAFHGCAMKTGVAELARFAELTCNQVADVIDHLLKNPA